MRKAILLLIAALCTVAPAQIDVTKEQNSVTITTSGSSGTLNNKLGTVTTTFEVIQTGAASTISVVIKGCMRGDPTCADGDVLDTYTTVANSIRKPTIVVPYDFYLATASWTGGTSPTVTVYRLGTIARNGGSGSGGSGTPGGSNTFVQFNDSGSFGATTDLTFNKSTKAFHVGGAIDATNINNTGIDIWPAVSDPACTSTAQDWFSSTTANRRKYCDGNSQIRTYMNTADVITTAQMPAKYATMTCEGGLGDGTNAITAATYHQSICRNETGATLTITAIRCRTDNSGTSTLNVTDDSANALLTGAITCTSSYANGTQGATTTLAAGGYFKFTFIADGTSKETDWAVVTTR